MKNPFNFNEEPFEAYSEFDGYEEEQPYAYSEFDSEFLGGFDTELADFEGETEVRRGRRVPFRRKQPSLRSKPRSPIPPRRFPPKRPLWPPIRTRPWPPVIVYPDKMVIPEPKPRPKPPVDRREPPVAEPEPQPGPTTDYREPPITEPEPQGTEYIRWVQSSLNQIMGLQLPVNGIIGSETRSAIRSFQQKQGLPVDGIVGPETERSLIAARSSQPSKTGDSQTPEPGEFDAFDTELADLEWEAEINRSSPEYIRWVQSSLNRIMGFRLAVDGIMGPQTRSAIRSFQQRKGLTLNGIVGPRTEAALIASGASPPSQTPTCGMPSTGVQIGRPDIVNVRGIWVARQIAPKLEALLAASEADGIRLGGGGYRSPEKQIELRKKHCGTSYYDIYQKPSNQCKPPTARPGQSMHERGLAIDFTYNGRLIKSRNNPGFRWLYNNAATFGFCNLPSEPWHWSVNGR